MTTIRLILLGRTATQLKSADGDILAVLNLSDWYQADYCVNIGSDLEVELLLDSDSQKYSGTTPEGKSDYEYSGNSIRMNITPFSGMMFLLKKKK